MQLVVWWKCLSIKLKKNLSTFVVTFLLYGGVKPNDLSFPNGRKRRSTFWMLQFHLQVEKLL